MAAIETERSLQKRDARLDPGSEVSQLSENPFALGHVGDVESDMLAEDDVLHLQRLDVLHVGLGREATVEGHLPRKLAEHTRDTLDRFARERRVCGIAFLDNHVEHESTRPAGEQILCP